MAAMLFVAMLIPACGGSNRPKDTSPIFVFAAASLREVIEDTARAFEKKHAKQGYEVVGNFAGSNALAQQIRSTTRADIFISASEAWMDDVESAGRIVPESRRNILRNRLVVIVATGSELVIDDPSDLATAPIRHLSIGDPRAVPAGIYAKEWLESISHEGGTLWDSVQERIVPGTSVRAALGLVEADRRIAGIVYATDAEASDRVEVLYEVPHDQGPEIRYTAALVRDGRAPAAAREFLDFLTTSPRAQILFLYHGFDYGDDLELLPLHGYLSTLPIDNDE